MTLPFQKLVPKLLPAVPGCPWNLAQAALRDAAREFCQRTHIWRASLAAVSLEPEQPFYAITAPAGAEIVMVLAVELQGRTLTPATDEWLDRDHPGWIMLPPGRPSHYLITRPAELRLIPPPLEALPGALVIRAALAPAENASETEAMLVTTWGSALMHGALARLMEQLARPWGSAELSLHHARQFRAAIAEARSQVLKGQTTISLTARPRVFG